MATGDAGTALCEEIAGDGLAAYGRDIAAQPDAASAIARAVELAPKVIGCSLADVVRVGESGVLTVIGSSDPGSSAQLVRAAAESHENPAPSCGSAPGRVVTSGIAGEDRWLRYARAVFEATGLRSEISVGLTTADETTLVMRFFSERSKPWTEIQQCDVAAFVDLSALAIDRAVLRTVASNLRQALTGNRVIATAVGILMHRHRLDQVEAFDMLRTCSQNSNRKIRSVADEVVSTGALPDAPGAAHRETLAGLETSCGSMSVATQPGQGEPGIQGVPIAVASEALHVPMPTLRSWELRYGIPESDRVPGKHRRYSEPEMHALRLMRDEIARGTRASVAAKSVRTLLGVAGPAGELIQQVLDASSRLDTDGVRAQLTKATDVLGIDGCIDEVMLPAMRQIGQWWMEGRCDLSQEQLTTEAARAWLDKRSAFAPTPTATNPIILACGPGDLHTIGLEALALLLRHRGWPCRVLGARVSTESLTTASVAAGAAGVVIVAHLPTGRRRALASISAVHERGIPVFWAGNAFSTRRSRAQIPGCYLGVRMQDAADLVVSTLTSDHHGRR